MGALANSEEIALAAEDNPGGELAEGVGHPREHEAIALGRTGRPGLVSVFAT
jgi:hypothetical protein